MRTIDTIIIHCAATRPKMDIGATEIRRWHMNQNGWDDVGYHWVIRRDGTVEAGRDETIAGAHARGHNQNSIGICLVGGLDKNSNPDCNYTAAQWEALENLVADTLQKHPGILSVIGHRDVSSKTCPCFDVKAWFEGFHEQI